ncbi:MAG: hypothetical protein EPN70_05985 [Paraburkholderia sp.]|uniref:hypothetical protein n=1 Tax=Paraburkholderia sp. TaxID=1926495 RepID=UPI0011FB7764|nr:hypothetical protein [Paraburkholderia sp.]TAM06393.1 MAG: hypothetical protein EPN70_05985 [Paraburkholderia sp.]
MSRNFSKLLDEISAIPDADGVIRPLNRGTAGKKAGGALTTIRDVMMKAGLDADKVKPFTGRPATIREKGVKVGDKVLVKGKTATTDKPAPATPPEHVALRVARAIGEMKQHAQGRDLNGPVTPKQLAACHALARAGEMSQQEVADVEKALNDKRALPTYLLRKLSNA